MSELNKNLEKLILRSYNTNTRYPRYNPQKLAELIVQECFSLTLDYKNDEHYAGWIEYRELIKKHFAIKDERKD